MFIVKAIKCGSGFSGKPQYKTIDVEADSASAAMKRAETELGAEWGVFSAETKNGV